VSLSRPKPWTTRFFPLDGSGVEATGFGDVARLWLSKRVDGPLPPWSGFDVHDFRPWIGNVSVDDVTRDPFDCRTRLWGTGLVSLYGYEATGKSLRETYELRGMTEEDFQVWVRVASEPCIALGEGTIDWQDRDHVQVRRIFLPCGEDGRTTDVIISVAKAGR
jgi:hypothetical protein